MSTAAQFLTDQKGKRTAVVVPIDEYEELMEDLEDLAAIAERKSEPTVPLEKVIARLKKDGLLSR